jgi:hypothetical protein
MPPDLLAALCNGAVVQNMLARAHDFPEFKAPHARVFLQLATDLVAWDKHRRSSLSSLNLRRVVPQQWAQRVRSTPAAAQLAAPGLRPCDGLGATAQTDADFLVDEEAEGDNTSDDGNILMAFDKLSITDKNYAADFRFDVPADAVLTGAGEEHFSDNDD